MGKPFRIRFLTDLHLNPANMHSFGNYLKFDGVDVVAIGGDTSNSWKDSYHWIANKILPKVPAVVMVNGNHDYSGSSLIGGCERQQALAAELGLCLLEDGYWESQTHKVRILGSTLWTDFALYAEDSSEAAKEFARKKAFYDLREAMPEYHEVDFDDMTGGMMPRRMRPDDAHTMHKVSREFLDEKLTEDYDGETVVLTHHAPHPKSISDKFQGHPINPAFVSDLSDVIRRHQPTLWLHGHVHTFFDYPVGATRVVCNPHGYKNRDYDWNFDIDLDVPLRSETK